MERRHQYRRDYCTELCPRRRNRLADCANCRSFDKADAIWGLLLLKPLWEKLSFIFSWAQERCRGEKQRSLYIVLLLSICIGLTWQLPIWQTSGTTIVEKERFELEDTFRKTTAQILAGLGIAIGIFLTWRRTAAMERTVQLAEEEQITERFTRTIKHIGSDKMEIRLGGIYALERIARDSERDFWTIMEVLTAYVRTPKNNLDKESLSSESETNSDQQESQVN